MSSPHELLSILSKSIFPFNPMPNYSHSTPLGYKLNTGKQARFDRAERALKSLGSLASFRCESTGQNSSSVALFPSGLKVLISYTTAVAYKLPDGSAVATLRGEFSRTTDRAVDSFVCLPVRLDRESFRELLAGRLEREKI